MSELAWIDASGANPATSACLLLGALLDAGVPTGVVGDAVDKVAPGQVRVEEARLTREDGAATGCRLALAADLPHRSWSEVELLLAEAGLHEDVRALAHDVFARVAESESVSEGSAVAAAPLREAGAADRVVEVVGVCAAMVHLDAGQVVVRPPAGAGTGLPTTAGAALLATLADDWGDRPAMSVTREGVGAADDGGTVRLLVGDR